jgi:hypothetical protein
MVFTLPPFFPHRRNRDGSFDSICLKCLLTIANERSEADLAKHDKSAILLPSPDGLLIALGHRIDQNQPLFIF